MYLRNGTCALEVRHVPLKWGIKDYIEDNIEDFFLGLRSILVLGCDAVLKI